MEEKELLYIPAGLKTKTEIFEGFSKVELYQALLFNVCAGGIAIVGHLIFHNVAGTIIFMITSIAASVIALTKDKGNVSVYDQIRFLIRFSKAQKTYPYRALDEWA